MTKSAELEERPMLGWGTMLYGAALSAFLAAGLVAAVIRPRRPAVLATAAVGALAGPLAWNAILRAAHGDRFFTDAPVAVLPLTHTRSRRDFTRVQDITSKPADAGLRRVRSGGAA